MQRPALMLPMGEQDYQKGVRENFLWTVASMLDEIGCDVGVELKGNEIGPDGWVKDLVDRMPELQLTWHPGAGIARTLGDPAEPIPSKLENACRQAKWLKEYYGLRALTIHLAPALTEERTGGDRFFSPLGAEEMLEHLDRQIDPLCRLVEMSGGILAAETVDIFRFSDDGYKTPTYLALQSGAGHELAYIRDEVKRRSGQKLLITVDTEHVVCSSNVLTRRGDMSDYLLNRPNSPSLAQTRLAEITGYWLEKGQVPSAVRITSGREAVRKALTDFQPSLLHLGAAIEAVTRENQIGTHLPYNPWDNEQMKMLDEVLRWSLDRPEMVGWVIEVCSDKADERYSSRSPRPQDDDIAKMMSFLVVADHLKALKTKS